MFDKILPYLLSGISVGGQYALIAVGYTMVYGILRLINFAHGDIFTAAGFFMVYIATALRPLSERCLALMFFSHTTMRLSIVIIVSTKALTR